MSGSQGRSLPILLACVCVFQTLIIYNVTSRGSAPPCPAPPPAVCPACPAAAGGLQPAAQPPALGCRLRDMGAAGGSYLDEGGRFLAVASKYPQTDKVIPHHYEAMYAKYLDGMTEAVGGVTGVRMLEIGLGCGMPNGAGGSIELWRNYFGPTLDFHLLEYVRCVDQWDKTLAGYNLDAAALDWYAKVKKEVYWGSQSDPVLLQKVVAELKELDVVVDDGGHTMEQQITSFLHLFPIIAPGGVYVIEDLETSYYYSQKEVLEQTTTVGLLQRILQDLAYRPEQRLSSLPIGMHEKVVPLSPWIRSIDCDRSVCVITKRRERWHPYNRDASWQWPCEWNCDAKKCKCKK
eukprot:TRINITY_DN585_c1_g2_i5.p1 TRINITY_DN585_c1_g2~~TRINITY_DN585_c1_g2_i5.p1  ORF type:complete len:348 (+),score=129.91 TRINITY_DN585_c1_g2_i5:49-1092(+)